ncbi:hypothetical protein EB118_21695 [bacterium]|nr:hypothetical protein [bacterium]
MVGKAKVIVDNEEKLIHIQKYVVWKRFNIPPLSVDMYEAALFAMNFIDYKNHQHVTKLARLCRYASCEEVKNNIVSALNVSKFGSSLETLTILFGKEEANIRFNKAQTHRRKNGICGPFGLQFWLSKGYTENEARDIISSKSYEASKVKYEKFTKQALSQLLRESNPSCPDYWKARGYSDVDDIEHLRRKFCTGTIEYFLKKYGEIEGTKLFNLKYAKRKSTIQKRYGDGFVATCANKTASKMSRVVFDPLAELCDKLDLSYYYGVPGNKEWWCRDYENKSKYYFYDFTIPSLNIIFEYNGSIWHPRGSKEDFKGPLADKYDYLLQYDTSKRISAEKQNFTITYVWDDDPVEVAITKCKTLIKEQYVRTKTG